MIVLILTYYVLVYLPITSLQDHAAPEESHREVNPIDSGLFRQTQAVLGRWYAARIPTSDKNEPEDAFNKVKIHFHCF